MTLRGQAASLPSDATATSVEESEASLAAQSGRPSARALAPGHESDESADHARAATGCHDSVASPIAAGTVDAATATVQMESDGAGLTVASMAFGALESAASSVPAASWILSFVTSKYGVPGALVPMTVSSPN